MARSIIKYKKIIIINYYYLYGNVLVCQSAGNKLS